MHKCAIVVMCAWAYPSQQSMSHQHTDSVAQEHEKDSPGRVCPQLDWRVRQEMPMRENFDGLYPLRHNTFLLNSRRPCQVLKFPSHKKKNSDSKVNVLFHFSGSQESHFPVTFLVCLYLFSLQAGMTRIGRKIFTNILGRMRRR